MKTFLFGIVMGVILVGAGVYFYFSTGSAPVATEDHPMPLEKTLAHKALAARIEREMPKTAPITADESAYLAGAKIYVENCAMCHGFPGEEPGPIAKGMFPKPPQLFRGMGVTDDEPGETYWKVSHGIRLTGMPSFGESLTETQMWQVSLLLANANKISEAVKQQLQPPPAAPVMPANPPQKKK